jgi:hypothetical protein
MKFAFTLPDYDRQYVKKSFEWAIAIVGIGFAVYYGYPYFLQKGAAPKIEHTTVTEENIKSVILSGEAKMYFGNITKIAGQAITINTALPGDGATHEVTATLTAQTLIRKIEFVSAVATSTGLVPAKTSVASTTDLSISSQIMMGVREDGSIAMIDLLSASGGVITRPPDKIIESIIPAKISLATKEKISQLMRSGKLNVTQNAVIKKIDLQANSITAEITKLMNNVAEKSEVVLKITDGSLLSIVVDGIKQYALWDKLTVNDSVTIFYTKENEILEIIKP